MHNKQYIKCISTENDSQNATALLVFGLQIYDFISDICFPEVFTSALLSDNQKQIDIILLLLGIASQYLFLFHLSLI